MQQSIHLEKKGYVLRFHWTGWAMFSFSPPHKSFVKACLDGIHYYKLFIFPRLSPSKSHHTVANHAQALRVARLTKDSLHALDQPCPTQMAY